MSSRLVQLLRLLPATLLFLVVDSVAAQAPAGGPPPGLPVKAVAVSVGAVSETITAVGTLRANESVMLRPEIEGRVRTIRFTEGQTVKAGAVLLSLDPAEYQAGFDAADAQLQLDTLRARRAEELFKQKLLSRQALDEAQANLAVARAARNEAAARLAKTELRAPFAGIVGLRAVSPGDYVKAGQDIVRIEDTHHLKLDFSVPEPYLPHLHAGLTLEARVDAWPDGFKGEIYAVETALDEQSRSARARARIPNPDAKLRPGMFARVTLALATRPNALRVPEQAIVPKGGSTLVFKVVNGKVAITPVTTGVRRDGLVEITSGLTAADQVITDGQIKLQDGMPVTVMGATPPASNK